MLGSGKQSRFGVGLALTAVLIAVALDACTPPLGVFQNRKFSFDSIGSIVIDTTRAFDMTPAGVSSLGACGERYRMGDTTLGISDSARAFLLKNGYCQWASPEYHDDQKFRINNGKAYGPLVHTFAAPATSQFVSPAVFDRYWINVAIVIVDAPPGATLPPEYQQMQLQPGYNCVFLRYFPEAASYKLEWRAVVIPSASLQCPEQASVLTAKQFTEIATIGDHGSTTPTDFPAVSRFLESRAGTTFIGVRCGNVWCIVGAADRNDFGPPTHEGTPSDKPSKNWKIKGWFDDQHLAVPTAGTSGTLVPGPAASIVPMDTLSQIKYFGDWIQVATVVVEGGMNGEYAGSTRTAGYRLVAGENKLWLHSADNVTFEAFIGNAAPRPTDKRFKVRMTAHGYFVPGTARWRWNEKDEHLWVACLMGCCLIEPD